MRFLVTAIGSMSAEAVIKSLRRNFPNCQITGTDTHPGEWLYLTSSLDRFFRVPMTTDDDFMKSICSIIDQCEIDFIIPLTDPEVDILSKNRKQIESDTTKLTLPYDDVIKLCRNKEEFSKKLRKNGRIDVIESYSRNKIANKDFSLPAVAKPKTGRSSEGLMVITSYNQLSYLNDNYIVQPFIEGDIITVDLVRDNKGNFACLPRKELIRTSNGAGLCVEIFQDLKVESLISEIATTLDIIGCMNIEFINVDDHYYVMDINPRFSAGIGFSILAEYDFIFNHAKVYLGGEIKQMVPIKKFIATKYYNNVILNL